MPHCMGGLNSVWLSVWLARPLCGQWRCFSPMYPSLAISPLSPAEINAVHAGLSESFKRMHGNESCHWCPHSAHESGMSFSEQDRMLILHTSLTQTENIDNLPSKGGTICPKEGAKRAVWWAQPSCEHLYCICLHTLVYIHCSPSLCCHLLL